MLGKITLNFISGNENSTKSRELSNQLLADEPTDCFFADSQFDCGIPDVERLTLAGVRHIHNERLKAIICNPPQFVVYVLHN